MKKIFWLIFAITIIFNVSLKAEDSGEKTVTLQQGASPDASYNDCYDTVIDSVKITAKAGTKESIELTNKLG